MCGPLLLLIIGVPAVELVVIIEVGRRVGSVETLCLLAVAFIVGLVVIRGQVAQNLRRMQQGLPPNAALLSGPLLFVAAVLLMFPGFVSDALALPLLVPPLRSALARLIIRRYGRPLGSRTGLV
ncbi:MAG: FxsA family protein [Myxococcales bacterium]|nr:FxsA family protein [Myxococcales bacterium]